MLAPSLATTANNTGSYIDKIKEIGKDNNCEIIFAPMFADPKIGK